MVAAGVATTLRNSRSCNSIYSSISSDKEDVVHVYDEISTARKVSCTALINILYFLIVYDRLAIDGIVPLLQEYFHIANTTTALLQTISAIFSSLCLIVVYMYGDKLEKKKLLLSVSIFWLILVILALLVNGDMFWLFLILRSVGAVAFSVVGAIAPVVFADFFEGSARVRSLMVFSLAPLLGALISMAGSSWLLTSGLKWQIALLFSPAAAFPIIIVLIVLMPKHKPYVNPHRKLIPMSVVGEIRHLFAIKTYTIIIFASALASLYGRAMSFWMPTILLYGWSSKGQAFYFGLPFPVIMVITLITGFVAIMAGMPMQMWIAENWQNGKKCFARMPCSRAIPIVISCCNLLSEPLAAVAITMFVVSYPVYLVILFLKCFISGGTGAMMTQMVLDVLPVHHRAAGMALNNLVVGLLDSPAALFVGSLSDWFRGDSSDDMVHFKAFVLALYILLGTSFASSSLMLASAVPYPSDVEAAKQDRRESQSLLEEGRERSATVMERALIRRPTLDVV